MPNRYEVDFDNFVWKNVRRSIRNKGESSIWYKFLYSIFKFFEGIILVIVNFLYNQIFFDSSSNETLIERGKEYLLSPKPGESIEDFKNRLKIKRSLVYIPPSVELIKRVFKIYLNVDAEVIQGSDYPDDVFTIGVTPLGSAICVNSMYFRFVYEVILPDLSSETIDRDEIKEIVDDYNFGGNEFIIKEDRPSGYYIW